MPRGKGRKGKRRRTVPVVQAVVAAEVDVGVVDGPVGVQDAAGHLRGELVAAVELGVDGGGAAGDGDGAGRAHGLVGDVDAADVGVDLCRGGEGAQGHEGCEGGDAGEHLGGVWSVAVWELQVGVWKKSLLGDDVQECVDCQGWGFI
ncbi:hypothetical protein FH972_026113 [Carpinus fangiana]|uniref:Uncharacterized protein n=1 Tax=Carpinus fangiana TaxID=176857 RepID=A0A5N6L3D6_9ROSI|nr:hypothetical protein FH972_026113 [Carpinus fangiana]